MSADIFSFANELSALKKEEVEPYLESFFVPENAPDYYVPEYATEAEKEAVLLFFESEKPLDERVIEARNLDPMSIEAFFVELSLREEVLSYSIFKEYYDRLDDYDSYTVYAQENLCIIVDLFVEYLLDIHYIKGAIAVQKRLNLVPRYTKNISRLSYLYYLIEDGDAYYDLFLNEDFEDPASYLLLINTLLKCGEQDKAREVLNDMFAYVPYSDYIDRIWELDSSIEEARVFADAVDRCFDDLCSVPYFFTWCSQNREEEMHA